MVRAGQNPSSKRRLHIRELEVISLSYEAGLPRGHDDAYYGKDAAVKSCCEGIISLDILEEHLKIPLKMASLMNRLRDSFLTIDMLRRRALGG